MKLSLLRQKLWLKAKREPRFRFYTLYAHICREDVLWNAWLIQRRNHGAPGVDGVTFEAIEQSEEGPLGFVKKLAEELRNHTYKTQPVRRVYTPKPDGSKRPLGIPTIRDRVAQRAALLILEPIFEADFEDCSYGFRPKRSAHQALEAIQSQIKRGRQEIYDADLKGYFDSIPHEKLIGYVETRIADGQVLKLIRTWLKAPVIEPPGFDSMRDGDRGTPQGGVISPLLSNLYLHQFDHAFHTERGPANWAKATLIRYADDFVVLARYQSKSLVGYIEKGLENGLGLKINREKTKIVNLKDPGACLNFLGYTLRFDRSRFRRDEKYLNMFPSDKSVTKIKEKIREHTDRRQGSLPPTEQVKRINRTLQGWQNYFKLGYPSKVYSKVNWFVQHRLHWSLRRRSQRPMKKPREMSWYGFMHKRLGLHRLSAGGKPKARASA